MNRTIASFESHAARTLEESSVRLADTWLERVKASGRNGRSGADSQVAAHAATELIRHIAGFVRSDDADGFRRNAAAVEAIRALIRAQRGEVSPAALLHDLELLAQVLDGACLEWLDCFPPGALPPDAVLRVAGRLNRAPMLLGEMSLQHDGDGHRNGNPLMQVRQFADMLSHELNTPLNAASVTAQLLEYADGTLRSAEARRLVTLIRRNLARADTVMQDVRAAALSTTEREDAAIRPFGQVLGEVLAEVHDELVAEGVRIDVDEPIADVTVDAARVKLILINLIRNAIRYSDQRRSDRWVCVSCSRNATQDCWWVLVSDNGLGIPAEHQSNIFHRFFRAHPDRANGTGLGLLIVQEEVAQLGGEIEFASEPGVGTTFRFVLPAADPPPA